MQTVKQIELADIISQSNCGFSRAWGQTYVFPRPDYTTSNYVGYRNDSAGDGVIAATGIEADGPYFLSVAWGQGFGVHQLENDGSITEIYHDLQPNNSYNYYCSLGVDKTRKVAYVGNHAYDNLRAYDYSAIFTGGAVVKGDTMTEASHGLPSDEVGYGYGNGLMVVGDYLYIIPDDKSTSTAMRWNITTQTADNLAVTRLGWSGRYGYMRYDADIDRLYMIWRYYASVWAIENASTAGATAYQLDFNSRGISNYMYGGGVVWDNSNHNILYVMGNREFGKYDITTCVDPNGSNDPVELENEGPRFYSGPWHQMGESGILPHPDYGSDLVMMYADRGYAEATPFFDKVNHVPIGSPRWESLQFDATPLNYDYGGNVPLKMQSENGTTYYLMYGYSGSNGHKWYTYDVAPRLPSAWSIEFGTYTFDDSRNVQGVNLLPHTCHQMIGTTMTYYASNDNGTTWETITPGTTHTFSSTGSQVRIRLNATGDEKNAAHIIQSGPMSVLLDDGRAAATNKRMSYRLSGGS